MKTYTPAIPSWTTSTLGHTVDTSPVELAALSQHLERCRSSGGHFSALQGAAQTMTGFASARFVTTILAVAVLTGVGYLFI